MAGEVNGRQVAIMAFDIHNTDLPLQITWPVLMANLMDWFSPQSVIAASSNLTVGDPLAIHPPLTADSVRVTLPDGSQQELPVEQQDMVFGDTDQLGVYTLDVLKNGVVTQSQSFTVNLFDTAESDITPKSTITLGQTTVTSGVRQEVGQLEFWPVLALLGLLILLLEWYIYQRRQRVTHRVALSDQRPGISRRRFGVR